jgi:hypothetical protein
MPFSTQDSNAPVWTGDLSAAGGGGALCPGKENCQTLFGLAYSRPTYPPLRPRLPPRLPP